MSRLFILAMELAVSGCVSGLRSSAPPTQVYVLRAAEPAERASAPLDVSVRVARPLADPGLDSERIVLVQADHRMGHYAASRWPAELPEVVESLVVSRLRATGAWAAVQDSLSPFPADYLLRITIRRFEADYVSAPRAPVARVVLDCTLGRRTGREVVATFVAEGSAQAEDNRLGAVVAAFQQAVNEALAILSERAQEAAARDLAAADQKVESPVPSRIR